jgi:hypothetical protein
VKWEILTKAALKCGLNTINDDNSWQAYEKRDDGFCVGIAHEGGVKPWGFYFNRWTGDDWDQEHYDCSWKKAFQMALKLLEDFNEQL